MEVLVLAGMSFRLRLAYRYRPCNRLLHLRSMNQKCMAHYMQEQALLVVDMICLLHLGYLDK